MSHFRFDMPIADNPGIGQIDSMLAGGAKQHAGLGLAAFAVDPEFFHCSGRMMRAKVNPVKISPFTLQMFFQHLVDPLDQSQREIASGRACLICDQNRFPSRIVNAANRRRCPRKNMEPFDVIDVADLFVDCTVSI
jgi:hypothetical protein